MHFNPHFSLASLCALLAFTLALPALAKQENHPEDAAILALLEAMGTREQLANTLQQLEPFLENAVAESVPERTETQQQKQLSEAVRKATWEWIEEELNWETLTEMYLPAYRETFTAEQVDDLTAFFKSPVGQVYVSKQGELSERVLKEYQTRMVPMMQRMQERVDAITKEVAGAQDGHECCGHDHHHHHNHHLH